MRERTVLTEDVRETILLRLSQGESLRAICRDRAMPAASTVYALLWRDAEFARHYARAKEAGVEAVIDEALAIADDASAEIGCEGEGARPNPGAVQLARLRVETRKWYAAKIAPKKYGERPQAESDSETGPVVPVITVTIAKD